MSDQPREEDLTVEVDTETYQAKLVERTPDKPYEPPPKSEQETPEQVQARARRQRRHQRDIEIADLRRKASAADAEYEKLLNRHNALEPLDGPDPVRTGIFAEAQFQKRLAAAYRKRAARLEQRDA